MRRLALLTAVLLAGAAAAVQAQSTAALGEVAAESDADHFSSLRVRAGGLFGFQSPWNYRGVAVQDSHYAQSGWHRDAKAVLGLWRDQSPKTLAGIDAQIGVVQVAGHTRPIGDVDWALRPAVDTGLELVASAGIVETRAALERGIGYTSLGGSVEQQLAPRWTFVGLGAYQPFSDGNARLHWRGRLIWDVLPDEGITLQARWRRFHDSSPGSGTYFNPDSYEQWMAVVGLRRRVSGWLTTAALGAGQELIRSGNTTKQPAYLAELRVEGPAADPAHLAIWARYNRSAALSTSPQYWWASLGFALIVPF